MTEAQVQVRCLTQVLSGNAAGTKQDVGEGDVRHVVPVSSTRQHHQPPLVFLINRAAPPSDWRRSRRHAVTGTRRVALTNYRQEVCELEALRHCPTAPPPLHSTRWLLPDTGCDTAPPSRHSRAYSGGADMRNRTLPVLSFIAAVVQVMYKVFVSNSPYNCSR